MLGAPCHHVMLTTDASLTVLGSNREWLISSGSVGRPSPLMAHKLSGNVGHASSTETLSPRPERQSCACSHRQHIGGL